MPRSKKFEVDFIKDIKLLASKAGYQHLTPFQTKAIPFLCQDKNCFLETKPECGKMLACLLSLPNSIDPGIDALQIIVLTNSEQVLQRIAAHIVWFTKRRVFPFRCIVLDPNKPMRINTKQLSLKPKAVFCKPEQLIDQLRQNQIDLSSCTKLILDIEDPAESVFERDLCFIYSKLPAKIQTILMTSDRKLGNKILPTVPIKYGLGTKDWLAAAPRVKCYPIDSASQKMEILDTVFLAEKLKFTIILIRSAGKEAEKISQILQKKNIECAIVSSKQNPNIKEVQKLFLSQKLNCLILDIDYFLKEKIEGIRNILFFSMPSGDEIKKVFQFLLNYSLSVAYYFFTLKNEFAALMQAQEIKFMNTTKENIPTHEEALSGFIASTLEKIRNVEDVETLNRMKKIFKKQVPVFLRSYFAAYLLMDKSSGKIHTASTASGTALSSGPGPGPANPVTIFLSIGKNRKLFPRDLIQLFAKEAGLTKTDIGDIRIFDNYSFVEVAESKAQAVIHKLNGYSFRGKKISVNFARKKEEN